MWEDEVLRGRKAAIGNETGQNEHWVGGLMRKAWWREEGQEQMRISYGPAWNGMVCFAVDGLEYA